MALSGNLAEIFAKNQNHTKRNVQLLYQTLDTLIEAFTVRQS